MIEAGIQSICAKIHVCPECGNTHDNHLYLTERLDWGCTLYPEDLGKVRDGDSQILCFEFDCPKCGLTRDVKSSFDLSSEEMEALEKAYWDAR